MVRHLGVDETSFLKANRHHATIYATGLVDLKRSRLIDVVEGNAAKDLRAWTANADPFHVARIANRCLDKVRRRVQNETLRHRGRNADPLYRIRKLMLRVCCAERLDERGTERLLLGLQALLRSSGTRMERVAR